MKLTSVNYSASSFNVGMLLLRAGMGGLLVPHGYDKLTHFSEYSKQFINFMGLGAEVSLGLVIFAELFCAALIVFGLFTRLAAIPPMVVMLVAVFKAHKGEVFGEGEHAMLYFFGFLAIAIIGPGRLSVDGMIGK
jgi:putative oxidoreductase